MVGDRDAVAGKLRLDGVGAVDVVSDGLADGVDQPLDFGVRRLELLGNALLDLMEAESVLVVSLPLAHLRSVHPLRHRELAREQGQRIHEVAVFFEQSVWVWNHRETMHRPLEVPDVVFVYFVVDHWLVERPRVRVYRLTLVVVRVRVLLIRRSRHNMGLTNDVSLNIGNKGFVTLKFVLLVCECLGSNRIDAIVVKDVFEACEGQMHAMFQFQPENNVVQIILEPVV
jgi:hypothetical protein